MPELPEVETMVRGIRPAISGREIVTVRTCRCPCKPISIVPDVARIRRRTVGRTVTAVRRVAKRVVIELSSGDAFVVEPRMTGLMLLADPPDAGHLRFEWRFGGASPERSLWFWDRRGLGTVRLCSAEELAALCETRLGPDALELTGPAWRERCRRTRRPIKVALLDQKLAAGIGNLYASEILHLAGIHPETPADRLRNRQVQRLADAVRQVLEQAIRYEGSTLGDGTYRNALNRSGGYQNEHRVYDRTDELCRTCGLARIRRIVQAQRSTFFCPACQK